MAVCSVEKFRICGYAHMSELNSFKCSYLFSFHIGANKNFFVKVFSAIWPPLNISKWLIRFLGRPLIPQRFPYCPATKLFVLAILCSHLAHCAVCIFMCITCTFAFRCCVVFSQSFLIGKLWPNSRIENIGGKSQRKWVKMWFPYRCADFSSTFCLVETIARIFA